MKTYECIDHDLQNLIKSMIVTRRRSVRRKKRKQQHPRTHTLQSWQILTSCSLLVKHPNVYISFLFSSNSLLICVFSFWIQMHKRKNERKCPYSEILEKNLFFFSFLSLSVFKNIRALKAIPSFFIHYFISFELARRNKDVQY